MRKVKRGIRRGVITLFLWLAYMILDLPPLAAIVIITIICLMFWAALISEIIWSMAGFM